MTTTSRELPSQPAGATAPMERIAAGGTTRGGDSRERRHDLDALRGWAMLLGIVLHASMSFFPVPWAVQDTRQNGGFGLLFVAIHGFRMPLFFLLGGYFTLLVFRRRGLVTLLQQRALRILIPCLLGLVTVLPALHAVSGWAIRRAPRRPPVSLPPLFEAIRQANSEQVREQLAAGVPVDEPDPVFQILPLHWAALVGETAIARQLLDAGAPLDRGDSEGNVPLIAASFAGRGELIELLLERGADPNLPNREGQSPVTATEAPVEMTLGVFEFLGLPPLDPGQLIAGRERVHALLDPLTKSADTSKNTASRGPETAPAGNGPTGRETGIVSELVGRYARWLRSDRWQITWRGQPWHLIQRGVFDHLWFLWFLWWMVALFGLVAICGGWTPGRLTSDPAWLLAGTCVATVIPQVCMHADRPGFGPDTATGWIIPPHLFVYYSLFFLAGCLMCDNADAFHRWTRRWPLWLGLSLLVLLPLGLVTMGQRVLSAVVQPLYAWLMCLGCLGLFERWQANPSPRLRYLSDSSYWLYVAHMPVVIALQSLVAPWNAPALLKFVLVLLLSIPLLLLSYHLLVRPTPLGWLLNGRREPIWGRSTRVTTPTAG